MVLISEMLNLQVNKDITFAVYTEGPDHFDEWYALVKQKYPNITSIYCWNNGLTSIKCFDAIKIYCNDNELISLECPNATLVSCPYNKLKTLICPNATIIYCDHNELVYIECPNTIRLYCDSNKITNLECPKATVVSCSRNKLTYLNLPKAFEILCQENELTYLECPKASRITCHNNPDLEFINSPSFKYLRYDGNSMIPSNLVETALIENSNCVKMSYDDITAGIIKIRQKYTKSARKI